MCLFVRELRFDESVKLSRWLRQSRNGIQMRRAQVIAFSGQGMRVQEIAARLGMHQEYLRELIRRFNAEGFDGLVQRRRSGRPPRLSEEEKSIIVEVATAPPQAFGRPFNQWSLRKLQQFLVSKKLIRPVSHSTIGRVLKKAKVSFQRTRTWKRSSDPAYEAKKNASRPSTRKRRKGRVSSASTSSGPSR